MTLDPNDPRLTAYVLGELDPSEHEQVESLLRESDECRRAVEEIRLTTGWLTTELHHEQDTFVQQPLPNLQPLPNHQPVAAILGTLYEGKRSWWSRSGLKLASLAAVLLLCLGLTQIAFRAQNQQEPRTELVAVATSPAAPAEAPAGRASKPEFRVEMLDEARAPTLLSVKSGSTDEYEHAPTSMSMCFVPTFRWRSPHLCPLEPSADFL
jgi:anti-sigma factor RsiW